MATVKQLRDAFNALPASQDDAEVEVWLPGSYIRLEVEVWLPGSYIRLEVEVWLPGSYIRLEPKPFFNNRHRKYLIEGNLQPGSALER